MHLLDLAFGMAARGPRFFEDGWGDRELCDASDPELLMRRRVQPLSVALGAPRPAYGGMLRDGSFESPEDRLPTCGRRARIQALLPTGELRGIVLQLAASGDQGFRMRLRFAAPLLARGIGSLVLENAYYGGRKPENQVAHAVRSVSDLYLMAAATFQEGRALLRWLRTEWPDVDLGVTGFSMGGQMAAMVGASMEFPVAVVPVAPSCSPDSVLREGVLRHTPFWLRLCGEGETEEAAREAFLQRLSRFSVTSLPAPVFPAAAIVVGTAEDGVVPPSDMRRIAEYWGAELRWLPAGHVSAVLRHQGEMREALVDAFDRLEAAQGARRARRRRHGVAANDPVRAVFALAARAADAAPARHRRSAGRRGVRRA
jgi:dienelactone hydrolase